MQMTGMGKNSVYDAINTLKSHGLLRVEQSVDSRGARFGRREFVIDTNLIGVFVPAKDLSPLPENREPENREPENREPENREPENREPENREPENRETYLLKYTEPVNYTEQLNKLKGETHAQKNETAGPNWMPTDPDYETSEMLADELCVERFFRQINAPVSEFQSYASRFLLKIKSEGAKHTNRKDFRSHFFSWARLEHERDEKNKKNGLKFNSPDTISDALDFAARWQRETELGLPH